MRSVLRRKRSDEVMYRGECPDFLLREDFPGQWEAFQEIRSRQALAAGLLEFGDAQCARTACDHDALRIGRQHLTRRATA